MSARADIQMGVEYARDLVEAAVRSSARSILRHWYAGCALAGFSASPRYEAATFADVAHDAIKQADAVLRSLDAEQKKGGES